MTYRAPTPPQPLVYLAGEIATALERETGRVLWRYQANARLVRIVYTSDRVFMLDADCLLHCVRTGDGVLLGTIQVEERAYWGSAMLAGSNGELYVATSKSVIALDPSGRELWRFSHRELPSSQGSGLAGLALPEGAVQPDIRD